MLPGSRSKSKKTLNAPSLQAGRVITITAPRNTQSVKYIFQQMHQKQLQVGVQNDGGGEGVSPKCVAVRKIKIVPPIKFPCIERLKPQTLINDNSNNNESRELKKLNLESKRNEIIHKELTMPHNSSSVNPNEVAVGNPKKRKRRRRKRKFLAVDVNHQNRDEILLSDSSESFESNKLSEVVELGKAAQTEEVLQNKAGRIISNTKRKKRKIRHNVIMAPSCMPLTQSSSEVYDAAANQKPSLMDNTKNNEVSSNFEKQKIVSSCNRNENVSMTVLSSRDQATKHESLDCIASELKDPLSLSTDKELSSNTGSCTQEIFRNKEYQGSRSIRNEDRLWNIPELTPLSPLSASSQNFCQVKSKMSYGMSERNNKGFTTCTKNKPRSAPQFLSHPYFQEISINSSATSHVSIQVVHEENNFSSLEPSNLSVHVLHKEDNFSFLKTSKSYVQEAHKEKRSNPSEMSYSSVQVIHEEKSSNSPESNTSSIEGVHENKSSNCLETTNSSLQVVHEKAFPSNRKKKPVLARLNNYGNIFGSTDEIQIRDISMSSSGSSVMLQPMSKNCLHKVTSVLGHHFGENAGECIDIFRNNSFDLIRTVQELLKLHPEKFEGSKSSFITDPSLEVSGVQNIEKKVGGHALADSSTVLQVSGELGDSSDLSKSLLPFNKRILNIIAVVLGCHFSVSGEDCMNILYKNNYNIIHAIQELQVFQLSVEKL